MILMKLLKSFSVSHFSVEIVLMCMQRQVPLQAYLSLLCNWNKDLKIAVYLVTALNYLE